MRGSGPGYSTPKVPLPGVLTDEQRKEMRIAALARRDERFGVRDPAPRDDPDAVVAARAAKDAKINERNNYNLGKGGRKKGTKRVKRSKRKTHRR